MKSRKTFQQIYSLSEQFWYPNYYKINHSLKKYFILFKKFPAPTHNPIIFPRHHTLPPSKTYTIHLDFHKSQDPSLSTTPRQTARSRIRRSCGSIIISRIGNASRARISIHKLPSPLCLPYTLRPPTLRPRIFPLNRWYRAPMFVASAARRRSVHHDLS